MGSLPMPLLSGNKGQEQRNRPHAAQGSIRIMLEMTSHCRSARHCSELSVEVVQSPSLAACRSHVHVALGPWLWGHFGGAGWSGRCVPALLLWALGLWEQGALSAVAGHCVPPGTPTLGARWALLHGTAAAGPAQHTAADESIAALSGAGNQHGWPRWELTLLGLSPGSRGGSRDTASCGDIRGPCLVWWQWGPSSVVTSRVPAWHSGSGDTAQW